MNSVVSVMHIGLRLIVINFIITATVHVGPQVPRMLVTWAVHRPIVVEYHMFDTLLLEADGQPKRLACEAPGTCACGRTYLAGCGEPNGGHFLPGAQRRAHPLVHLCVKY